MNTSLSRYADAGWPRAFFLFFVTLASTIYVGASSASVDGNLDANAWRSGLLFGLPLMFILVCHEFGHFIVGRRYGVDVSPPYFIPFPFGILGTMGAVIAIREVIKDRKALLDIGMAGPLAGLVAAIPILGLGLHQSTFGPAPEYGTGVIMEGHSLFYDFMILAVKGGIPHGQDIYLSPLGLAGWVGLLVTMINLIPAAQLDGGHIAYALLGKRADALTNYVIKGLLLLGLATSLYYFFDAKTETGSFTSALPYGFAGMSWVVWAGLVFLFHRRAGYRHPPTRFGALGWSRKLAGGFCLVLFVLLFMPFWMRVL